MPIGPAARARAAQRELDGGAPPTADAFWSEDSAALHDAVQAPSPSTRAHLDPPVGLVPPLAGRRRRTLSRLPRLRLGGARTSRWWGLAAVPIVALVVVGVIGTSESPASHPAADHGSLSRSDGAAHRGTVAPSDAERLASASKAASAAAAAAGQAGKRATRRQRTPGRRPPARTRVRNTRHTTSGHVTAAHHSTGPPAPTVTEAAAAPSTQSSAPATTPSSSADSAASSASAGGATGSKPATGPAGPTRIGSVTGGCSPKCS